MDGSSVAKKIIFTTIPILIFIGIAYVGYRLLIGTAAGAGLNKFFGGVGAVLGMAGAQLTTCANNGFFNVSKGCYLGVAGVAVLAVWAICAGLQYFKEPINARIKYMMQRTNKTEGEIVKDVLNKAGGADKINQDLEGKDADVAEAAAARAFNNALSQMVQDEAATDPNSRNNIELTNKNEWISSNASNNDNLDAEDAKEADDAGNEIFPEPSFD